VFLAVGTVLFLHETKTRQLLSIPGGTLSDRQPPASSSGLARDLVDEDATAPSSSSTENASVSEVSPLSSSSLLSSTPLNGDELKEREQGQGQEHRHHFTSPRINFTLHHGRSIRGDFMLRYNCLPNYPKRVALPSTVQNTKGLFDFLPEISTNLRILVLGDSLGRQFSQAIVESLVAADIAEETTTNKTSVLPEEAMIFRGGGMARLHMTTPTRGGGFYTGYMAKNLLNRRATETAFTPAVVEKILTDRSYNKEFGDLTNLTKRSFDIMITPDPARLDGIGGDHARELEKTRRTVAQAVWR